MTYGGVYEAVADRYDREDGREEFVHARDRTELNVAGRVALPLEHGEAFMD
jgi:hypothetical protein